MLVDDMVARRRKLVGGRRERLGFIEALEDGPEFAERLQRVTELEPEIDRLLA